MRRHDFSVSFEPIQVVGPRLHHAAPFREILGSVVTTSNQISFTVRELTLDRIRVPTLFIQQRRCRPSKPATALYVLVEASRRAIFFCCRSADGFAICATCLRMIAPFSLASASVISGLRPETEQLLLPHQVITLPPPAATIRLDAEEQPKSTK